MGDTVCETIDSLLASVQQGVDDPDQLYKLRTARQLARVCEAQHDAAKQALDEADLDQDTLDNLRQMGYLD